MIYKWHMVHLVKKSKIVAGEIVQPVIVLLVAHLGLITGLPYGTLRTLRSDP